VVAINFMIHRLEDLEFYEFMGYGEKFIACTVQNSTLLSISSMLRLSATENSPS
jgi:hypothetical protein